LYLIYTVAQTQYLITIEIFQSLRVWFTSYINSPKMAITPEQAKLVQATVPVLKEHGTTVTTVFYKKLLEDNPSLKSIFNEANQVHLEQPKALASAVLAYAENINNLGALGPTVELIANKHASLYVQPEQYAIVGKYLLAAFQEVLGDAMTPELLDAWGAAYGQLADVFIKKESAMYKSSNGWSDWKEFRIAKKIKESSEITSFYLEPVDESMKPLPEFLPGQYISIQVEVPTLGHMQARQYSLSDAPWPDYYRISVKRETGVSSQCPMSAGNPGLVSNIMHNLKNEGDIVRVSYPRGDFFLDSTHAAETSPLVLISGGVGLTALTSILNSLVARHSTRPISWVHAARTSDVRAFGHHIKEISRARRNVRCVFFDARPRKEHVRGQDYDHEGRLSLTKLDKEEELFVSDLKTQYYICGPKGFMTDMHASLLEYGVDRDRILMELFGTGGAH
jgi:nitric oxide dioxygenase